jgi:hypothetical protein
VVPMLQRTSRQTGSLQGGHILLKTRYGLVLAVPWWGTIGSPSVVHPAGPARPLKGITL